MRFTTASRMSKIDKDAVEDHGLTEAALMENAGQLTARHARRKFLPAGSEKIGIVCGKGHNGADAMVVGRWLQQWNYPVTVLIIAPEKEYEGLPFQQLQTLRDRPGLKVNCYDDLGELPTCDLWIDGLFGTGLSGDPRSPYDDVIQELNRQAAPVVSVDIPSGLSGDDNRPFDPCVQADLTVTYGLPKLGLLLEPGHAFVGELIAQEIGFPSDLYNKHGGNLHLITPLDVVRYLPGRYPTAHKGSSGRVSIIGGSDQYSGAPFLVGNAASTAGAGLTGIIGPENISTMADADERDLIFPRTHQEIFNGSSDEYLKDQDAAVIGPGLGRGSDVTDGLKDLIPSLEIPAVVDADGLNSLQDNLEVFSRADELILTPHPGEASRLLDVSVKKVLDNPIETTQKLVDETGHTIILKSSRPVVGHSDGAISVNVTGTAALAKAGSGDVLSGIIGGLLAQQVDTAPAACLGLYIHGAAGRHAAENLDTLTVRSPDIIDQISTAIDELEDETFPDWYPVKSESHHQEVLRWNPFPN